MRPPMVKTEDMVAKVASDMGIQSGNQGDWELAGLLYEGLTEANQLAALARRATPMDFFWQVTTSCGALSSAWRVGLENTSAFRFLKRVYPGRRPFACMGLHGEGHTYQVISELEGSKSRDEDQEDEVYAHLPNALSQGGRHDCSGIT